MPEEKNETPVGVGGKAPASTTPAAPAASEKPASENKKEVESGNQPTTNPAQGVNHDAHAKEAEAPSETPDEADDLPKVDELTMLKDRARLMGITHSNNIGVEALRDKIAAKLSETSDEGDDEEEEEDTQPTSNVTGEDPQKASLVLNPNPNKKLTLREYQLQEQLKLVRVRITCLDPKKKDLHGEILTVANEFIGTVRKFVPYGEYTDNGYHIPYCLFEHLREREFLNVRTRKGKHGTTVVERGYVREFAIEVLPPLTQEDLAKLSASQMAAGGLDS